MPLYQETPYSITPNPTGDNGPAIRSALLAGYRWIQINGPICPISTKIDLHRPTDKYPYHGTVIEPGPGIEKVTVDSTGIGRNPNVPSDPSYAAIDYQGNVRPGSYLTSQAYVNQLEIFVGDSSVYTNGDWIVISDASTNFAAMPLPLDGPMEVRQVLFVNPGRLTINRALKREHPNGAIVAKVTPIRNVLIRGLEFTGNSAVGVHLHYAQNCTISTITSTNWRGRALVLLDNGGENNLVLDCYCTGTEAGGGPTQNAWGVVAEGQDNSMLVNCGGERCGNGSSLNYCIDTLAINARAQLNNCNVNPHFASIRSGFIRPRTGSPLIIDTNISDDCVDCFILNKQPFA